MSTNGPAASGHPLLFALPRLASSYINTGLLLLLLPAVIVGQVGEQAKGLHLGAFRALAALLCVVAVYVAGRRGDRSGGVRSRRRQVLSGLLLAVPFLLALALVQIYTVVLAAFLGLVLARALVEAGHVPMLVGRGDDDRRVNATAMIAFCHFVGAGLAALAFALLSPAGAAMPWARPQPVVAVVVVVTALTGFAFATRGAAMGPTAAARVPLRISRDLRLLLIARLFFLAAMLMVGIFLLYIVRDVFGARDVNRTAGLLYGASLLGAVAMTLPAAGLARRLGEVPTLLAAGTASALAAPAFLFGGAGHLAIALASIVVFAGGFGAIVSVGLSMTVRLVERPEYAGRVFAVLTMITFASDFLASASGALVLDPLNRLGPNFGYYGLLALIEVYFVAGAIALLRIGSGEPARSVEQQQREDRGGRKQHRAEPEQGEPAE